MPVDDTRVRVPSRGDRDRDKNSQLRAGSARTCRPVVCLQSMYELHCSVFPYSLLHPVTFCFGIFVAVPVQLESIAVYTEFTGIHTNISL